MLSRLLLTSRVGVVRNRIFYFSSVSETLDRLVQTGKLHHDPVQKRVARRLSILQETLEGYDNSPLIQFYAEKEKIMEQRKAVAKAPTRNDAPQPKDIHTSHDEPTSNDEDSAPLLPPDIKIPRGLYIFGQVGTGKSMLMDTFFSHVPIVEKKRRVHFHAFLQDVHQRIHRLKQQDLVEKGRSFHVDTSELNNPIVRVAKQLASEVSLLCFDEFQVTDVADALILKQLFSVLFQYGTVVVATSNRPPKDLYEGGINRSYFMPFIDLLEHHCIVHQIKSEVDYRKLLSEDTESFFLVDPHKSDMVDWTFTNLLNGEIETTMTLSVGFQRHIIVSRAHPEGLVGRFSFDELCRRDVGASDFRAVAQALDVVIIENVPQLNLRQHNEARRFITLIDELYEHRCALMCTSEHMPDDLFLNSHEAVSSSIETRVGETFGIDVAQSTGKTMGELASVRELKFAFQRASSRISEMCSRQWWDDILP